MLTRVDTLTQVAKKEKVFMYTHGNKVAKKMFVSYVVCKVLVGYYPVIFEVEVFVYYLLATFRMLSTNSSYFLVL